MDVTLLEGCAQVPVPGFRVTEPGIHYGVLVFWLKAIALPDDEARRIGVINAGFFRPSCGEELVAASGGGAASGVGAEGDIGAAIGVLAEIVGVDPTMDNGVGIGVVGLAHGDGTHECPNMGIAALHYQGCITAIEL